MRIRNCRVNHIVNPLGYQMDTPIFSYVVEDAIGKYQTEARIVIASDPQMTNILADTGMTDRISSNAAPVEIELSPRTRYYWTVTVRTDVEDEEITSDVNFFETGKRDEPWSAKWLSCERSEPRHPIFHRNFSLSESPVRQARLYIIGLGLYEAQINGRPVCEEFLTPYCNDYNTWVQAQTYDVTDLLQKDNELSVILGNGWYSGRFGFTSKAGQPGFFGDDWKLIAELHVLHEDGSEEVINTDSLWNVTRSTITFSNIYDGERRDDTLEETAPEAAVLLPEDVTENIHLEDRLSLPVTAHEELRPVKLIKTPAGETVYDLGQNFAGTFRLHVNMPKGTVIHVQVGEVLQNGNFYRDNLRSALAEYWYTSDGVEKTVMPLFTFYGYRYAKVEGLENPRKSDFTGIALYSGITPAGSLTTGLPKINQLLSNISWGQKGNFLDVPTDCPQRDERMGWTADTQVFVPTACYMTDPYAFYKKFMYDMKKEQEITGGLIPNVIPSCGMNDSCSSVWGDAACIMPWTLYLYSGDRSFLEDSFTTMKRWVDYIQKTDGSDRAWGKQFHFGDWLALDNPSGKIDEVMGGTEVAYIAYVYYMNSARLTQKAASVLGFDEDAKKYAAIAESVESYIKDEYITKNGRTAVNTQTGNILALWFELTSNPAKPLTELRKLLKSHGNKLQTGFVGTPMMNRVLSRFDFDPLAYEILKNEEFPGWLYEINLGATTVWERWNSMNPDGSVSSTGMNSFNHYAYGAIGEWMWQTIGGLNPDTAEPGFRKANIRIWPDYEMHEAKAVYESACGTWKTEWKVIDPTHVRVRIEVPFDCRAHLSLPWSTTAEQELEPGKFEAILEAAEPLKVFLTAQSTLEQIFADKAAKEVLKAMNPDVEKVPASMFGTPLAEILNHFYPDKAQEMITAINEAFLKL